MALQQHGKVGEGALPRRREDLEPVNTGGMGSAFFRWRFAPEDLPVVLDHDWSELGRRVFVDPEREEVTLMAPSWVHEEMSQHVWYLVTSVAAALSIPCVGGGGATWSPPGSHRVEADQSFYLGRAALRFRETKRERRAGLTDAFTADNPPQLVVEIERTSGDAGKPDVYRLLGVDEAWRIDVSREPSLAVEFLDLQHPDGWRAVDRSTILPGLTPALIARALEAADMDGAGVIPGLLAAAGIGPGQRPVEPGSGGPGF